MNYYQQIVRHVSEIARAALGNMIRVGTVHEVKGEKLRMVLGKDKDGQDVLSPWLNTTIFRGGARESRFFKKGQNLAIMMPTGDPRQGVLMPFAPNKNFLRPDHSNGKGQDEETYQLDDLRVRKTKEGYDIWLQPPKQKQSQGELEKLPDHQSDASGQAQMKVRINKNGGITGRIGKNVRFSAHKKGSLIWTKSNGKEHYFAVRQDQKPYLRISEAPVIMKHDIPLDDV